MSSAFDCLLAALDADRDRAGIAYERLRGRVIAVMSWWSARHPEELADVTLDRVAQKLFEGAEVPAVAIPSYVRGVARNVFLESLRKPAEDQLPASEDLPLIESTDEDEPALACLDSCLTTLSATDRTLVTSYYDGGRKSEIRQRLADRNGLSMTALRIRTHRIRQRLESCVTACLDSA